MRGTILLEAGTMRLVIIGVLLQLPVIVGAQTASTCADSSVHLEYQMTTRAQWIVDTTFSVHPSPAVVNPPNLVQFVVDTLGVPQPRTFRVLRATDSTLVAEARRTFATWRFSSPMLNGCRVRQLVQTPVAR